MGSSGSRPMPNPRNLNTNPVPVYDYQSSRMYTASTTRVTPAAPCTSGASTPKPLVTKASYNTPSAHQTSSPTTCPNIQSTRAPLSATITSATDDHEPSAYKTYTPQPLLTKTSSPTTYPNIQSARAPLSATITSATGDHEPSAYNTYTPQPLLTKTSSPTTYPNIQSTRAPLIATITSATDDHEPSAYKTYTPQPLLTKTSSPTTYPNIQSANIEDSPTKLPMSTPTPSYDLKVTGNISESEDFVMVEDEVYSDLKTSEEDEILFTSKHGFEWSSLRVPPQSCIVSTLATCPFSIFGCTYRCAPEDLPCHFKICTFEGLTCPIGKMYNTCSWKGIQDKLQEHVNNAHPNNARYTVDEEILANSFGQWLSQVFSYEGHTFLLHMLLGEWACWAVQMLGSQNDAAAWRYKITIYKKGQLLRSIKISDSCTSHETNVQELFSCGQCVAVPLNTLRTYTRTDLKFFFKLHLDKYVKKEYQPNEQRSVNQRRPNRNIR